MTVEELIGELKKFPSSMEIVGISSENQSPHPYITLDTSYWNDRIYNWVDIDDGIDFVGAEELVRLWIDY